MSIAFPSRTMAHLRAPLVLACLMLAGGGFGLWSPSLPISFPSADYLGIPTSSARADNLLFGTETEPVSQGAILDHWHRVTADIADEREALRRCHADGPCPPAARQLLDISAAGAGRSGRARVGLINRAVDMAIAPASDERQWGEADRWSAPFETLQSRRGDCEDYAILKYLALLEAGVPTADVKIVILKHLLPWEDHAAVAARVDGEWLILDNLTLTLVRDTDLARSIPEFVLDQDGARRFLWTGRRRRNDSAG